MPRNLLESDSESNDETFNDNNLTVNNDYAQRYENWRRKEELEKLKNKYGTNLDVFGESDQDDENNDDVDDDDDDDESSEESINEEIFDEQFFKVYSALKNKAPEIYDKNVKFFDKPVINEKSSDEVKQEKPTKMTITEYHQKLIKEKGGITEEDEMREKPQMQKGYYEELDDIKNEFKALVHSDDDGDDDEENNDNDNLIMSKKNDSNIVKTFDLINSESKDKDISYLKKYWQNENLDENEKYLRDYILNKKYLDDKYLIGLQDKNKNKEMKLEEYFSNQNNDIDNENNIDYEVEEEDHEKDNKKDNQTDMEDFKINKFHFQEADATMIKRYPRTLNSMRNIAKETRSLKRSEIKERKKLEKESELKRLRKLKKEELKEKLNKLKEISGNDKLDFNDLDLNVLIDDENDFDPEKYDEKMKILFDDYYDENNSKSDRKKPKFDYDEEIDYNYDNYEEQEYDETLNDEMIDAEKPNSKKKKKLKKKDKSKKKINDDDVGIFEDLIGGDLPTRFRYRLVKPNDYGLTDEEILLADDKELNKWCSLKKISQYKNDDEDLHELRNYKSKRNNLELKKKIFKSLYGEDNEVSETRNNKKRKRRKPKKPHFEVTERNSTEKKDKSPQSLPVKKNKVKKVNKKRSIKEKTKKRKISVDRLKAYGLSNKEIKKRKLNI